MALSVVDRCGKGMLKKRKKVQKRRSKRSRWVGGLRDKGKGDEFGQYGGKEKEKLEGETRYLTVHSTDKRKRRW